MPPKIKLHKTSGKSVSSIEKSENLTCTGMDKDQEEKFQVELYWCIKQLQMALASGKLDNKKMQDNKKALNSLMSSSTSVVKKRQVMRLSLGDYREKMLKDEQKHLKGIMKIQIKTGEPSEKTVFVKKSNLKLTRGHCFNLPSSDKNLITNLQDIQLNESNENIPDTAVHSNNTFKFDFKVDEV